MLIQMPTRQVAGTHARMQLQLFVAVVVGRHEGIFPKLGQRGWGVAACDHVGNPTSVFHCDQLAVQFVLLRNGMDEGIKILLLLTLKIAAHGDLIRNVHRTSQRRLAVVGVCIKACLDFRLRHTLILLHGIGKIDVKCQPPQLLLNLLGAGRQQFFGKNVVEVLCEDHACFVDIADVRQLREHGKTRHGIQKGASARHGVFRYHGDAQIILNVILTAPVDRPEGFQRKCLRATNQHVVAADPFFSCGTAIKRTVKQTLINRTAKICHGHYRTSSRSSKIRSNSWG